MSVDPVEFVRARLDEDEAVARTAGADTGQTWNLSSGPYNSRIVESDGAVVVYDEGSPTDDEAAHIARHDPARVLRDVEAKRRILAMAAEMGDEGGDYLACLLTLSWADHPDFDEAWR